MFDELDWDTDQGWFVGLFIIFAVVVSITTIKEFGIGLGLLMGLFSGYLMSTGLITIGRVMGWSAFIFMFTGIGMVPLALLLSFGWIIAPICWIRN